MGYQESFVYSKSGNNDNIDKTIEIIKKYKYQHLEYISIAREEVLRDFSNNHKKKYPVINWPKGTKLLVTFGERYYQRSINRLFSIDFYSRHNIEKDEDADDFLINYSDEEYEILDDLEIVFIDDHIDPKLKGPFGTYFGNLEYVKNDDMVVTKIVAGNYSEETFYSIYGENGYIESHYLCNAHSDEDIKEDIRENGYTISENCEIINGED